MCRFFGVCVAIASQIKKKGVFAQQKHNTGEYEAESYKSAVIPEKLLFLDISFK
jgi:hypothetical protein